MATIAALAIKVSANISDLTRGIKNVNSSIGYMVKTAQNATPSMKSLEDVSKGLEATLNAVSDAQTRLDNSTPEGLMESQQLLTKTTEAAEKLQNEMNRIGEGVAGDILKMQPTLNNVFKAQEAVEQLKESRRLFSRQSKTWHN
ncbi:hypothetical protein FACS1894189_2370 [Planctomycetales bacterium]|nr:hypothetical protein FACS1894189_2370 [Planctomycetales bacterium]